MGLGAAEGSGVGLGGWAEAHVGTAEGAPGQACRGVSKAFPPCEKGTYSVTGKPGEAARWPASCWSWGGLGSQLRVDA